MQDLPHKYHVQSRIKNGSDVNLTSSGLSPIPSAPPKEFGGPGDLWSPETLLVASVVDCYVLGFKILADGFNLPWISLVCKGQGVLDHIEKELLFTEIHIQANLCIISEEHRDKANSLLRKAEQQCLITNSLKAKTYLDLYVEV